ncbi:MAG: hypothetical protein IPJ37_16430 [Bacteroidales bacterium]|nr:hypothetical protein [Bacteroidales bacterium]
MFKTNSALPVVTTTIPSSITSSTAIIGGNISSDGGSAIQAIGAYYGLSPNPSFESNNGGIMDNETAVGVYSWQISNLMKGTTYHVRAYARNNYGTSYGNDVSFVTSNTVLPSVYTLDANATSLTTATSGGNIVDDGGGIITERGLCYSTGNYSPTTDDNKIICGNGTGNFSAELTGLNMLSTFLIRAYAINSEGTSYGNQVILKTVNYICSGSGWDGATGYDSTKQGSSYSSNQQHYTS